MRLLLKNFKHHESLDLSFPEKGLILLKGKSGVGKSTIFEAIDFVINGVGDDVISWGKNTCKVSLDFGSFYIERTKKPNSFKLVQDDQEYLDDLAQEMLYKILNINHEEFNASAYIQQGQANSLLTLKPADQLRFIQKLAESHIDPDKFKRFVQQEMSLIESDITHIEKQIKDNEEKAKSITNTISSISLEPPIEPIINESNLSQELLETTLYVRKMQSDLVALKLTLKEAIEYSELRSSHDYQQKKLNDVLMHEQDIQNNILNAHAELAVIQNRLTELDRDFYNKIIKLDQLTHAAKQVVKELNTTYPASEGQSSLLFCNNELINLTNTLHNQQNKKHELNQRIKELSGLKDPVPCPHCTQPLMIKDGVIESHYHVDFSKEIEAKQIELKDINENIINLNNQISSLKKIEFQLQQKKQEIQDLNIPKNKQIDIGTAQSHLQEWDVLHQKQTTHAVSIKNLQKQLYKILEEKIVIQNNISRFQSRQFIDVSVIQKDIDILSETISKTQDKQRELQDLIHQYELYKSQKKAYDKNIVILKDLQTQLSNIEVDILTYQQNLHSANTKLIYYTQILDVTEKSALESIQNVLDMINISTKKYIETMFPDTGTSVEILNTATTKKGEERAKISLSITHQGQKIKNLKSFSGGQLSRLTLAFQLGLSELYKCPFLLVDEGFTGVDSETQIECIEFLKQCTTDKLVLVIEHHAHESLFDDILEIV